MGGRRREHRPDGAGGQAAADAALELTRLFSQGQLSEALNYQPGNKAYKRVWDDIIQAAEDAGVNLMCVFQLRYGEAVQKVKQAVESGKLGTIALATV